jgi:hypothetical protein
MTDQAEEKRTFVWTTASGCWTLRAKDEDEAYRICIGNRIAAGQDAEEAVGWFAKDDTLTEVDGELEDAPYGGELPEPPY